MIRWRMKSIIQLLLLLPSLSRSFQMANISLVKCSRTALTSLASSISPSSSESPRTLIRKGMQSFRDGDVSSSLMYFDRADESDGSLRPYLWQRGISYYYLDQFRQGSHQVHTLPNLWSILCKIFCLGSLFCLLYPLQFRLDVSVNPLDVEEIVVRSTICVQVLVF